MFTVKDWAGLLDVDLLRIVRDNLRQSIIGSDLPGDANLLVLVIFLRSLELASIASPNHDREDLIRVCFIEIEEGWLTL